MSSSESSACLALLLIIVLNSSKSIWPFPSVSTSPRIRVSRTICSNYFLGWNPAYHVMEFFFRRILTDFSQDSSQFFSRYRSIPISIYQIKRCFIFWHRCSSLCKHLTNIGNSQDTFSPYSHFLIIGDLSGDNLRWSQFYQLAEIWKGIWTT